MDKIVIMLYTMSISFAAFIIISCCVDYDVGFVDAFVWFCLKLNEITSHYFTSAMVLACLWLDPTRADPGEGLTFRFCFF